MRLRQQPVADGLVHGKTEMANERDGTCRGVGCAGARLRDVAPRAVGSFELLQGLDQFERVRRCLAEVLISAEGRESTVSRAVGKLGVPFVAAVGLAERFDPREQSASKARRHPLQSNRGPATREGREVNKVEAVAIAEGAEKSLHPVRGNFRVQCLQARERKDAVVKVRSSGAILSAAFGRELTAEEFAPELGGIAEQPGRKSRDL